MSFYIDKTAAAETTAPPPGLEGIAPSMKALNIAAPPGFHASTLPGMASPSQVDELQKFLQWKDPQLPVERAGELLTMFKLSDVAKGIREKYGMLPTGWRAFVESDQILNGVRKASIKPQPTIPGVTIRTLGSPKASAEEEGGNEFAQTNKKIDEILDSEERFVNQITEVQTKYLDQLFVILASTDKSLVKGLGLTQEEINQIFEMLPAIVRFSQQLLQKLQIISLVRKPPVTGEGRAIHVGKAFIEMGPKVHVYTPAITTYQTSLAILNQAIDKLGKEKSTKYKNFMDIWEEVSQKNEFLRGQQLNAVLITPMQRIPRYKMLLENLLKDCDNVDAIPIVKEALELFSSAAKGMNESMRQHEKLQHFFGAGADLKPVASTGGVSEDGKVTVKNQYVSKGQKLL